jgi:hypothetical protein
MKKQENNLSDIRDGNAELRITDSIGRSNEQSKCSNAHSGNRNIFEIH